MKGVVVIDTNLLLLLIVGLTSPDYIAVHKCLKGDYTEHDFNLPGLIIGGFSDIVTLPRILSETSNLARQIPGPARRDIQLKFRSFIERTVEIPLTSVQGARREAFENLGLTDAVVLQFCELDIDGAKPTLLTADTCLADRAKSLGCSALNYPDDFQSA